MCNTYLIEFGDLLRAVKFDYFIEIVESGEVLIFLNFEKVTSVCKYIESYKNYFV